MKILRTASLGFNFTGSYIKKSVIVKNSESKSNEQSCLGGTACQKLSTWRKMIPPQ